MMTENLEGIEIVVKDGRWTAYGPDTPRSKELFKILNEMGGVAETVPEGTHIFNVEHIAGDDYYATLEPKE